MTSAAAPHGLLALMTMEGLCAVPVELPQVIDEEDLRVA